MESCRRDPVALPRPPRARGGEQDARGDGRATAAKGGSRARRRGVARGDAHSPRTARAARAGFRRCVPRPAAAARAAAEAEFGEAAEAAAAAEEEAAKAEAAEHRAQVGSVADPPRPRAPRASRSPGGASRGGGARRRRETEVEERRARDAAATRIQSARRARAARVEFEKRRNAARLADSLRDESIFDADAKSEAARDAVADRRLESLEGRSTDERRMSGEDVQPASLKKDEEGAGPSEAAAEAGTDDENGSVLDKAATLGVAAATAAATEVLEHARSVEGADTVETLANARRSRRGAFRTPRERGVRRRRNRSRRRRRRLPAKLGVVLPAVVRPSLFKGHGAGMIREQQLVQSI